MKYQYWDSPLGALLLTSDDTGLTGVHFDGQRYYPQLPPEKGEDADALRQAKLWLMLYFAREIPDFLPPMHPVGTPFQQKVWQQLLIVPYGTTCSYGDIARRISCPSAQAVGGAVGRNPLALVIPCHRIVGANGNLTGYAAGLARKKWLLEWESAAIEQVRR